MVVVVALAAMWAGLAPAERFRSISLVETAQQRWHKGNLHTHSHWSDGDDYLESIALWYRDSGYQFLVFTDHNVLPNTERWETIDKTRGGRRAFDKLLEKFPDWVDHREHKGLHQVRLRTFDEVSQRLAVPGEFLLIQGEEISDHFDRLPIHLNAGNVREVIAPRGGDSVSEVIQNNVDFVLAERQRTGRPMMVHLNHPNFGLAVTAEDLAPIIGERFFEVYNGHPHVHNSGTEHHASTERLWDIVLTKRLAELQLPIMYGLAVDDGHNYHDMPSRESEPGRGWVMALLPELTPAAVIQALEAGRFYASSGVSLKRIDSSDRGLFVEIDPVPGETYAIEFIGTRRGYDPRSYEVLDRKGQPVRATRRYSADIGQRFSVAQGTSARYDFIGDEIYVRARVTSSAAHPNPSEVGDLKSAWVQPVPGPGCPPTAGPLE
ncbi:MAG: hypothetical protein KF774_20280 [Planctomyces sp.]|nr:hypothetical protein [Planctomyces sp.]